PLHGLPDRTAADVELPGQLGDTQCGTRRQPVTEHGSTDSLIGAISQQPAGREWHEFHVHNFTCNLAARIPVSCQATRTVAMRGNIRPTYRGSPCLASRPCSSVVKPGRNHFAVVPARPVRRL